HQAHRPDGEAFLLDAGEDAPRLLRGDGIGLDDGERAIHKGPGWNEVVELGVEAPARQGARSAHTGSMKATSNAARRDASAARSVNLILSRALVRRRILEDLGSGTDGPAARD